MNTFHWVDYAVLAFVLLGSLATGVYFACSGGKQKTTSEYFKGNSQLSVIPAAMSIMVSYISGILIIGMPAEVYLYGGMYMLSAIGTAGGAALAALIFIPLFYPLNLTSINTYLEMRFHSQVPKLMCTAGNILFTLFYTGLVIYAPSTTISIVTGFPIWMVIVVSSIVVIIYTSIGGLKAVIWTDVFQCVMMFAGVLAIAGMGIYHSGGIGNMMQNVKDGGRLHMWNFDPNPHTRLTFWTCVPVSMLSYFMLYGATQTTLQRYCGLPTQAKAKLCMLITAVMVVCIQVVTVFAGFGMYSYYYLKGCDPMSDGSIKTPNQLVPYFVMETMAVPGVPGLFVSALCAGGLSSASSVLNSASANTWVDLLRPLPYFRDVSEQRATLYSKLLVATYGVIAIGMAIGVATVGGTIIQLSHSFNGAIMIIVTGTIVFAAFCPWGNAKGAVVGSMCSFGVCFWLAMGSYMVKKYKSDMLPLVSHSCTLNGTSVNDTEQWFSSQVTPTFVNTTVFDSDTREEDSSFLGYMYGITFFWYKLIGVIIILTVGSIVSILTGGCSQKNNPSLLFECVRRWPCVKPESGEDQKSHVKEEDSSKTEPNENIQKTTMF